MFLVVAIPSYESMPVPFVKNLMIFSEELRQNGYQFQINIQTGAFLPHTRAKVCGAGLANGIHQTPFNDKRVSHILMVDSDILFSYKDFVNLLRHDVDLVAGAYAYSTEALVPEASKKIVAGMWDEEKFLSHHFFPPLTISESKKIAAISDNGLVKVDWVGAGFCLVKTNVFEKIEYPWFESEKIRIENLCDTTSEDVGFCRKVSRAGIPIYLDPFVKVDHYKSTNV